MSTSSIWEKYEKSKKYMSGKGLLTKTERNWNFYIGNQWAAVKDSDGLEDLPQLNFIKPTVKYKVSTIAQHSVTALFSDLDAKHADACSRLAKLFDVSWNKSKMDRISWKALNQCAIQGDSYVYWYDGDTRTAPQLIHNTQIHLGDENITNIQDQPYIIIEERVTVSVLRERARLLGAAKDEIDAIRSDKDTSEILLNKEEVGDKVTSLLYMEKKDGIVNVARATKSIVYEELHPIQQKKDGKYDGAGLTLYPVVPMVWEETPNSARGTSEVEQMIPNQLELNKVLARRAISVKMTAFPRMACDINSIANPEDLDRVGAIIKVNGGMSQAINNMITYLAPQAMSQDAKLLSDELLSQTKDLAGASDAALGNIDLSRVSGTAATTIRDQQQVPLNEQVAMYKEFVENVALLYFDLWRAYFPDGVSMDGIEVSTDEILDIEPNVRIDVAENTTLSRMAEQQELTNLFNNGKLTFEEYVEAYPEHSSIDKAKLGRIVSARRALPQPQAGGAEQAGGQTAGQPIDNRVQDVQLPDQNVSDSSMSYQDMQAQLAQG